MTSYLSVLFRTSGLGRCCFYKLWHRLYEGLVLRIYFTELGQASVLEGCCIHLGTEVYLCLWHCRFISHPAFDKPYSLTWYIRKYGSCLLESLHFPWSSKTYWKWYLSVIVFSAVLTPFHGVSSLYLGRKMSDSSSSSLKRKIHKSSRLPLFHRIQY